MSHLQRIDPAQAAIITKRLGQAFDFVRDMLADPASLDEIPTGAELVFRDVQVGDVQFHLTAYVSPPGSNRWIARVTGPAPYAEEGRTWRLPPEFVGKGMGGKWGSPPTSPESGRSAEMALDALEEKLRDATLQFESAKRRGA
jgi:hypothetical protein